MVLAPAKVADPAPTIVMVCPTGLESVRLSLKRVNSFTAELSPISIPRLPNILLGNVKVEESCKIPDKNTKIVLASVGELVTGKANASVFALIKYVLPSTVVAVVLLYTTAPVCSNFLFTLNLEGMSNVLRKEWLRLGQ